MFNANALCWKYVLLVQVLSLLKKVYNCTLITQGFVKQTLMDLIAKFIILEKEIDIFETHSSKY